MKRIVVALFVLLSVTLVRVHALPTKEQVLKNEAAGAWKQIHWAADAAAAQAEAEKEHKPILVFFMVNENAKPVAEHC